MKKFILATLAIVGLIILAQQVRGDPRGGSAGVAHLSTPRASNSTRHVMSVPAARPAVAPHPVVAPNFHRSYSPTIQGPRTLPYVRTGVPRSTIASQQRDAGRSTTTRNFPNGKAQFSSSPTARQDRHESHDRDWWRQHYSRIVPFGGGYYYWDAGYWYPCWGYDPNYSYDNDGPIYAYGDLMPDQMISNVQIQLQQEGYYAGAITGSLDPPTHAAIANYQRDHSLAITGAVDEPTVESLGLG